MAEYGCVICGADLVYLDKAELMECNICKQTFSSNAKCINGHFVCDTCHQSEGFEIIRQYCFNCDSTNAIEMAIFILKNSGIKMHGPEHHFLVPAVLLTAYYNLLGQHEMVADKLAIAEERSRKIPGGFCGFCGNCGAGVGTGIFISIILNSTPLSGKEWSLSNLMTSKSLFEIANAGGPRCCKRDTYISLETAIDFLKENLNIELLKTPIKCGFFNQNKECLKTNCKYYPARNK